MGGLLVASAMKIGESLIQRLFPDPEQQDKARLELMALAQEGDMKELDAAMKVIVAEANSGNWLAQSWRPITMLVFVFIVANNYIIAPYMGAMFGVSIALDIPPDMWELIKIGLGGYVVGRSAEKSVKAWKSKD